MIALDTLTEIFEDEGVYRMVALLCATLTTGETKDKSKEGLYKASQQTLAIADSYLEWADKLADVPRPDVIVKAK